MKAFAASREDSTIYSVIMTETDDRESFPDLPVLCFDPLNKSQACIYYHEGSAQRALEWFEKNTMQNGKYAIVNTTGVQIEFNSNTQE